MSEKLTDLQKRFAAEYLCCFNAAEAARRAGYSKRSARFIGSQNLSKPEIREEIERLLEESAMSAGEVVARLSDHARADMSEFLKVTGDRIELDLTGAARAGILRWVRKMKIGPLGVVSIELYDAQRALAKLADIWGMVKAEPDDGTDPESDEDAILEAAREIGFRRSMVRQSANNIAVARNAGRNEDEEEG